MIVRIMGDAQYRVDDALLERLNELDEEAVAALERSDEERLDAALAQMAVLIRERGTRLAPESLAASDAVIPPSDLTLEETRRLVSAEGFLPDPGGGG